MEKGIDDFEKELYSKMLKGMRKEYYKNWRKKNKDKIQKYNETFWKKQAQKLNNKEQ